MDPKFLRNQRRATMMGLAKKREDKKVKK